MSYACCQMCLGAGVIVCDTCKGTEIDAEIAKWLQFHPYG